jgi:hypothetical protein
MVNFGNIKIFYMNNIQGYCNFHGIGNFSGKILTVMFSTAQPVFVCDTLNRILTKKNRFNLSNSGQQQTT